MSFYGAFSPYPRRYGGGKPLARVIFERLVEARGTAIDAGNPATKVYVETVAIAREIAASWSTVARLRSLHDPRRTCLLDRWEKILQLPVGPHDTEADRRANLERAMARVGQAAYLTVVRAELQHHLGEFFVDIEHITPASATIVRPTGSYPWGVTHSWTPWASNIANLLILVQLPTGRTEGELRDAIGHARKAIDATLPATMRFYFYRAPEGQPAIAVPGGASKAGIYCDTPNTLDCNVFGS